MKRAVTLWFALMILAGCGDGSVKMDNTSTALFTAAEANAKADKLAAELKDARSDISDLEYEVSRLKGELNAVRNGDR